MTTAGDIYREIDRIAPFSLAQDWDNSGFLCGDREAPVRRVMAALDATMDVVREAAQKDCQMILTHHPVIFHPLRSVTPQEVAYHAVRAGIAIVCAHTNLDAAYGGVNEVLARRLALTGLEPLEEFGREEYDQIAVFVPEEAAPAVAEAMARAGAGAIGNYRRCSFMAAGQGAFEPLEGAHPAIGRQCCLEQVREIRLEMVAPAALRGQVLAAMRAAHPYEEPAFSVTANLGAGRPLAIGRVGAPAHPYEPEELALFVKEALSCPAVRYADGGCTIRRIAVCGGAGGSMIREALQKGAQALVTGDVKHDQFITARQLGLTLIDAGHFDTENIVIPLLEQTVKAAFPEVEIVPCQSGGNTARTV